MYHVSSIFAIKHCEKKRGRMGILKRKKNIGRLQSGSRQGGGGKPFMSRLHLHPSVRPSIQSNPSSYPSSHSSSSSSSLKTGRKVVKRKKKKGMQTRLQMLPIEGDFQKVEKKKSPPQNGTQIQIRKFKKEKKRKRKRGDRFTQHPLRHSRPRFQLDCPCPSSS